MAATAGFVRLVRVASYNIRKAIAADRRRRPERILAILAEVAADVVILQEADRRFGERQSALPFHLLAEQGRWRPVPFGMRHGSIGWHGNAVLVAPHVAIRRHQPIHLPVLEPRGAVLADLEVAGRGLRVVGTHLDLSGLWRRRQARTILNEIAAQAERLPLLLAGDLNEWGAGGCLRDFGHHLRAAPLGPSFHARAPVARLDRIFHSPDLAVTGCGVHDSTLARVASDHLPVWAEVRFA